MQLKHEQGNPQLSFSLNFLPRLPLPEDMTKTLLTKLGDVVKVQALLTGSDQNRGLAPGTMEMTGPLSPAAVPRAFGPIKSTLRELTLTTGGMFWPRHDQTRLDVSDFVALRVLEVPCNCLFPPESESRKGVYKLLPKSLQTLKVCIRPFRKGLYSKSWGFPPRSSSAATYSSAGVYVLLLLGRDGT